MVDDLRRPGPQPPGGPGRRPEPGPPRRGRPRDRGPGPGELRGLRPLSQGVGPDLREPPAHDEHRSGHDVAPDRQPLLPAVDGLGTADIRGAGPRQHLRRLPGPAHGRLRDRRLRSRVPRLQPGQGQRRGLAGRPTGRQAEPDSPGCLELFRASRRGLPARGPRARRPPQVRGRAGAGAAREGRHGDRCRPPPGQGREREHAGRPDRRPAGARGA